MLVAPVHYYRMLLLLLFLFGVYMFILSMVNRSVISNLKSWHLRNICWLTNNISFKIYTYIPDLCANQISFCAFRRFSQFCESLVISVCPSAWKPLPSLDGYSWNLIFQYFSKICRKKILFSLEFDENYGYVNEELCALMTISR